MPLYFVLSGFFFKAYEPKLFFTKKINNIVIPFLFWLIVSDILRILCFSVKVDWTIVQFMKDPLCRVIKCNGPLWFLVCLFTTNIMFYIINSTLKDNKVKCLVILFSASIGYWLFMHNIQFPLWIDSSLTALPFFFLGYCCKDMACLRTEYPMKKSLFLGVGLILISYSIYYTFDYAHIGDIRLNSFCGSPFFSYLNSMSFVIGVLLLCKVVKWLPVISYMGRYSIVLLCVHGLFLSLFGGKIKEYLEVTIWGYATIILIMCWLAIPVCKTLLPYFVAQKPLFKLPSENK